MLRRGGSSVLPEIEANTKFFANKFRARSVFALSQRCRAGTESIRPAYRGNFWKGAVMLVITRKAHEEIRIGDDIVVTILRTSGGQVKIGITAPRDIRVARSEVYEDLSPVNAAAELASPEAA